MDVRTRNGAPALSGVFNLRDLGGLPTRHGTTTASGRIYRADGLHRTDAAGAEAVAGLGIRHLIDLRTLDERVEDGVFDHPEIDATHIPLIERTWVWQEEFRNREGDLLLAGYLQIVTDNRDRLAEVLAAISTVDDTVVFHCTAGKDRTGVVAALLLALAGVDDDVIAADYARSAQAMVDMRAWYERNAAPDAPSFAERMRERGMDPDLAMKLIHAEPATMLAFLSELRRRAGSVETFVVEWLGLDPGTVSRLRGLLAG
jgi:protein-tyrosine phosphatase